MNYPMTNFYLKYQNWFQISKTTRLKEANVMVSDCNVQDTLLNLVMSEYFHRSACCYKCGKHKKT